MSSVDWDRMTSLRDDIGAEDFADILLMFVAEISEKLDGLTANDAAATEADFHFLRGSAANLGFAAMIIACERAEQACRTGQIPNVPAVLRAFEDALQEARSQLPELAAA